MPNSTISWLPARDLLTPRRLDLVVKWRLFRGILAGTEGDVLPLYRWHIMHRTGGREPGSPKRSLEDYERTACELLASMMNRGFDPVFHVKQNRSGDLVAGAHRVACALALGVDAAVVVVAKPSPSPWDAPWFQARGCAWITVRGLEEDLCRFRSSTAA